MKIPTDEDLLKRRKKKDRSDLEDEGDDLYDYHEDSDIPVTEKRIKEKKIRKIGKE